MRERIHPCLFAAAFVPLSVSVAHAHIDLLEPEARAHGTAARGDLEIDDNSNLKSGPCGQVTSGRTSRVATYAPGETITVRVREENAHVSYLRVSIDLDGEEFPLRSSPPPAPETQEEAAAAEAALGGDGLLAVVRENNDTPGFVHELEVTLPDATCSGCTLQVMQFMYDDPAAPFYFQCADLVLAAGGSGDAGAPLDAGGAGSNASTAAGGASAAPSAGGSAGAPATSSGGAAGATRPNPAAAGTSAAPPATALGGAGGGGGDDGASCSISHRSSGWLPLVAAALAAVGFRSRRHARARGGRA